MIDIKKKKKKIGIFGLGYVGLPRCIHFLKKKHFVIGFDTDKIKLEKLKNKTTYLTTVTKNDLKYCDKKKFIATDDFSKVKELDVIIFCLPTPLKNLKPDLTFIDKTFKKIFPYLKQNQILILESTSYPGTTREKFIPLLSKKFRVGENFYVCFSPERDDPGRRLNVKSVTRLLSGYSKNCSNYGARIYRSIFKKIKLMKTLEEAEMAKIYENVYRAVNIGLVNELKKICNVMKIDFFNVIEGAKTKPYGFKAFYPGPGLGGHCIPIDPYYLTWKAKKYGVTSNFIELAGKINSRMPHWIVNKIISHYKRKKQKLINKKCLILGVSYKKNINDLRETPSFKIMELLIRNKVKIFFSDPYINKLKKYRNYDFSNFRSLKLSKHTLRKFDFTILVTDHDKFNKKIIYNNSKTIFDTRNFFSKYDSKKIIQL